MTDAPAPAVQDAAPAAQEPSTPSPEVKQDEQSIPEAPKSPDKEEMVPLKRLNRVRAALGDKERQMQSMAQKIADLEKAVKPVIADKPVSDNFNSPEEYADALADWKISQKEKEKADSAKQPNPEQIAQNAREFERKAITFKAKEAEHMKSNPGYEKAASVVNTFVNLMDKNTPSFMEFEKVVFESDKAPALIQFLGENPIEIAKLTKLAPEEVRFGLEDIIEQLGASTTSIETQEDGLLEEPAEVLPKPVKPIAASQSRPRKTAAEVINDSKSDGAAIMKALGLKRPG